MIDGASISPRRRISEIVTGCFSCENFTGSMDAPRCQLMVCRCEMLPRLWAQRWPEKCPRAATVVLRGTEDRSFLAPPGYAV